MKTIEDKGKVKKNYKGTIIWYIVFIICIPSILYISPKKYSMIYLPLIDLIANVFARSGHNNQDMQDNKLFPDLYTKKPNNIVNFLSTNFIDLVALGGVAFNGIEYAFLKNNKIQGITVMLIMYSITFLLPREGLDWTINKLKKIINSFNTKKDKKSVITKTDSVLKKNDIIIDHVLGGAIILLLFFVETKVISYFLYYVEKK